MKITSYHHVYINSWSSIRLAAFFIIDQMLKREIDTFFETFKVSVIMTSSVIWAIYITFFDLWKFGDLESFAIFENFADFQTIIIVFFSFSYHDVIFWPELYLLSGIAKPGLKGCFRNVLMIHYSLFSRTVYSNLIWLTNTLIITLQWNNLFFRPKKVGSVAKFRQW